MGPPAGRRGGHGQAVAGLVLGYVCVLPWALLTFWLIVGAANSA
ncbi:hypothetical protein [Planobispora longispora]|nr:hypothetical protein [Planobispora longispora]